MRSAAVLKRLPLRSPDAGARPACGHSGEFSAGCVCTRVRGTHRPVYPHHPSKRRRTSDTRTIKSSGFTTERRENPTNPAFLHSRHFIVSDFLKGAELSQPTTDHSSSSSIGERIGGVNMHELLINEAFEPISIFIKVWLSN